MKQVWILVVGALLVAACGADAVAGGQAEPITCSTFYRADVTKSLRDGPVLQFDQPQQSETATFDELVFTGEHLNDDFDARSLNVYVSEPGRKHPLFQQLFQMEKNAAPENIFGTTGQGFTGLLYAYSTNGAELQFVCKSG